jgi:hypothetical protein
LASRFLIVDSLTWYVVLSLVIDDLLWLTLLLSFLSLLGICLSLGISRLFRLLPLGLLHRLRKISSTIFFIEVVIRKDLFRLFADNVFNSFQVGIRIQVLLFYHIFITSTY